MRGSGKGTGSRGFQMHPRGDKFIENFDGIFRPSTGSENKIIESLEKDEEEEDPAPCLEGFICLF